MKLKQYDLVWYINVGPYVQATLWVHVHYTQKR